MVNPQRGEVALSLDGRVHALRPTFTLIAEIEAAHGPLPALLQRLAGGRDWRVGELVSILQAALRPLPGAPPAERVAELVVARGAVHFRPAVVELLVNALAGAEEAPPPGKPTDPGPDRAPDGAPEGSTGPR